MFKFESECEDCNAAAKDVQTKTMDFILEIYKDISEKEVVTKHIPTSVISLMILSVVGDVLGEALADDLVQILMSDELSDADKKEEMDDLTNKTVKTSLDILTEALPIDVLGHEMVSKEDVGKVISFAEALKAKGKGNLH